MSRGIRLLTVFLSLHLISFQVQEAAAFTRMCPLNNAPVPLEYDEATGEFSLIKSSSAEEDEERIAGIANDEEVRLLKRASAVRPVQVSGSERKRNLRARRDESKQVYMARSCPCASGEEEIYCIVEGISGSVHDTCGVTTSALTLFGNNTSIYANAQVECFKLESHTVFIRNAWPVVVFWYLALAVFLVATENGKNVRQYVVSKICPSCSNNERRLDRIMQREMEYRNRLLSATTRFARLADGRGRYLQRTRGMRVPNDGQTVVGDEALGRWIAQAESLGILQTLQPTEYVLQTRKFNAKEEMKRREEKRSVRNGENEEGDDIRNPSTPTKKGTKQRTVSTPETIASCDDDGSESDAVLEEEHSEEGANDEEDEEIFDCTICLTPVEDGQKVGVLPCEHIFHAECLGEWIQRRNVCPLCQAREIAAPRAIEEVSNDALSEGADNTQPSSPSTPTTQSSPPSVPNRPQRSRLHIDSHSQQRRRRNDAFFIYSP